MKRIKNHGFKIKFDSNGTDPDCLARVIEEKLADYFARDVKGPLDERYDKLSGVKADLPKVKESIKIIRESGVSYEFRTTVLPTLLGEAEIEAIARHLAGAEKFVLQQFAPDHTWEEALRSVKPYEKPELERLASVARAHVANVLIRGHDDGI